MLPNSSSVSSGGLSCMGAVYQTATRSGVHRKTRQQVTGDAADGFDMACSNYHG